MDDYLREIEECRAELEPLETGEMHYRRKSGGHWVDTTQREIQFLKRTIPLYESIAAELPARKV